MAVVPPTPPRPPQEIKLLEAAQRHQKRLLAQIEARKEHKKHERKELVEEGQRIRCAGQGSRWVQALGRGGSGRCAAWELRAW